MAKQIKTAVSTGEEYEFLDINGNPLFTICMNPSDLGIVKRCNDLVEFLNTLSIGNESKKAESQEMSDKDESDDFEDITEEDIREISTEITEAENAVAEKLNALFDSDISTPIYSVMSPFTPLANGKLYIEEIVDKICVMIETEMHTRMKKVQSRMNKYTAKYHK